MTGVDGRRHPLSLPPGTVRSRHLGELRATAGRRLPAPLAEIVIGTAQPFVQLIVDVAVPRMVFGPVTAVLRFSGEAAAVDLANDTPYGLVAAVYSADHARARRVARRVDAGVVMINNYNRAFLGTPFGGFGDSGYGREHAIESLLEFTRTKTIREPSGLGPIPEWAALDEIVGPG